MIRFDQMPESFTGQALYYAQRNRRLNYKLTPERERTSNGTISCKLRRAGFVFCTGLFRAPAGIFYHGAYALKYRISAIRTNDPNEQEQRMAFAWEHFIAALYDVKGLSCIIRPDRNPINEEMLEWFSSSEVVVPQTYERPEIPNLGIPVMGPINVLHHDYLSIRAIKEYRLLGCQAYPYNELKETSSLHPNMDLNHKDILRLVRIKIWSKTVDDPIIRVIPSKNRSHLNFATTRYPLSFTISKIELLYKAVVIAIGVYALKNITENFNKNFPEQYFSLKNYFNNLTILTVAAFAIGCLLIQARKAYNRHREAEMRRADDELLEGNIRSALNWYGKAALDGYGPAQRMYGLGLLCSIASHDNIVALDDQEMARVDEALNWIYVAAVNGDEEAKLDFAQFHPNLYMLCGDIEFRATQAERLKWLFRERNLLGIARERFRAEYNLFPEIFERLRFEIFGPLQRVPLLDHALNVAEGRSADPLPNEILGLIAQYI